MLDDLFPDLDPQTAADLLFISRTDDTFDRLDVWMRQRNETAMGMLIKRETTRCFGKEACLFSHLRN